MLVVGVVISNLMVNVHSQAKVAAHRERRASVLYAMSKELAASQSEEEIVRTAVRHLHSEFSSRNVILFSDSNGRVVYPKQKSIPESLHGADLSVAQWVLDHNEMAGQGTNTLPVQKLFIFLYTMKIKYWACWRYCQLIYGACFCPNSRIAGNFFTANRSGGDAHSPRRASQDDANAGRSRTLA